MRYPLAMSTRPSRPLGVITTRCDVVAEKVNTACGGIFYEWRARRDYCGLSMPFALRAVLRTFKIVPDDFVELGVLI